MKTNKQKKPFSCSYAILCLTLIWFYPTMLSLLLYTQQNNLFLIGQWRMHKCVIKCNIGFSYCTLSLSQFKLLSCIKLQFLCKTQNNFRLGVFFLTVVVFEIRIKHVSILEVIECVPCNAQTCKKCTAAL